MTAKKHHDELLREMFGESDFDKLLRELGDQLREARFASGRSLRSLAEEMGTSTMQFYHWENARASGVSLRSLYNYADVLGMHLDVKLVPKEDVEQTEADTD